LNGRGTLLSALALAPSLLCIAPLRHGIESHMPAHMLLEFPLLFASGWIVAGAASPLDRWLACLDPFDAQGLLGITFAACALTLWMIPTALDLALLSDPVRWGKYVSLWLAGLLLQRSQGRLSAELSIFFIGMLAWMLATVGLIFQTLPRRLCVNYLLDEQRWTGVGIVGVAVLLGTLGLWRIVANRPGSVPVAETGGLNRPGPASGRKTASAPPAGRSCGRSRGRGPPA
jgi:hypothetical protein